MEGAEVEQAAGAAAEWASAGPPFLQPHPLRRAAVDTEQQRQAAMEARSRSTCAATCSTRDRIHLDEQQDVESSAINSVQQK